MNYVTKLIERFGKGPKITTVPPKEAEASAPSNEAEPVKGPAEQATP